MVEFIDKTSERSGTPLSRSTMMAVQGFIGSTIVFEDDEIIETNSRGETRTTKFSEDGSVVDIFAGEKILTKTTTFNADGSITEVIS